MAESPATVPKPPLEVGSKFVGYEIRGLIGQGGHACVFHGYDSFMGQHVAIKVLYRPGGVTKEMMQRGQAEAQLLHRLRHPNIVEVSRAGIEDGLLFIVMELLRGRSLRTILEQEGRLAVEEVLFLSAQIADAAAAAHEQKAIHRDLKPDNVFITADNRVKVLDFGIAKLMDHAAWTTQKNIVLGTMLYMSPEQVQGLMLTPQSDIYALGLLMYTALFGRHPCLIGLQNATFAELTRIQVTRNPPALDQLDPRIPSHVARLVGRAIAKLPEERPKSMRQFAADIRRSLERYVGEQREQHQVLQTRDLSRTHLPSGFRVHAPEATLLPGATDTQPVSHPAFLGDVSAELAARVDALGPFGTAPLPREVVLPPSLALPTPIVAPAQAPEAVRSSRRPSTPVVEDPSVHGSPSSRRPSSADKPTLMSLPGALRRAVTPSTAPPVERKVGPASRPPSSAPALKAENAPPAHPIGAPARASLLHRALVAGLAVGAVVGVGVGLAMTLRPSTAPTRVAAPPAVVVESATPHASSASTKPASPKPIAPPASLGSSTNMQERLEGHQAKPAPQASAKPAAKPRNGAIHVRSGLAF